MEFLIYEPGNEKIMLIPLKAVAVLSFITFVLNYFLS